MNNMVLDAYHMWGWKKPIHRMSI